MRITIFTVFALSVLGVSQGRLPIFCSDDYNPSELKLSIVGDTENSVESPSDLATDILLCGKNRLIITPVCPEYTLSPAKMTWVEFDVALVKKAIVKSLDPSGKTVETNEVTPFKSNDENSDYLIAYADFQKEFVAHSLDIEFIPQEKNGCYAIRKSYMGGCCDATLPTTTTAEEILECPNPTDITVYLGENGHDEFDIILQTPNKRDKDASTALANAAPDSSVKIKKSSKKLVISLKEGDTFRVIYLAVFLHSVKTKILFVEYLNTNGSSIKQFELIISFNRTFELAPRQGIPDVASIVLSFTIPRGGSVNLSNLILKACKNPELKPNQKCNMNSGKVPCFCVKKRQCKNLGKKKDWKICPSKHTECGKRMHCCCPEDLWTNTCT